MRPALLVAVLAAACTASTLVPEPASGSAIWIDFPAPTQPPQAPGPCAQVSECGAVDGGGTFCSAAGPLCLDGWCITSCELHDTCTTTDGGLVDCAVAGLLEPLAACLLFSRRSIGQIVASTCAAPAATGSTWPLYERGCGIDILDEDGGKIGSIFPLYSLDGGAYFSDQPQLGGRCAVSQLRAPRKVLWWSCPSCSFEMRVDSAPP